MRMKKSYYMILGVPRSESASRIKAAYRRLAEMYPPDRAAAEGTQSVQEITEAYDVLSDPTKRMHYDHDLDRQERGRTLVEPMSTRHRAQAEPLSPEPVSIRSFQESIRPSFDELVDRVRRNFTGIGVPKAEGAVALSMAVVLTQEEAYAGGVLPVAVPAFETCPACGGAGRRWLHPCSYCEQQGTIATEATVDVSVPPMVQNGHVIEVPLSGIGISNLYLRIHIVVE